MRYGIPTRRAEMAVHEALWAEIDLKAIRHNFRLSADMAGPDAQVMAVVKADAYGHGAVEVAKAVAEEGAGALGVARICEAEELRRAGLDLPILIFGYTPPCDAARLADQDITQAVFSRDYALELDKAAEKAGCTVKGHLKIDSGMGRIGFLPPGNHGTQSVSESMGFLLDLKHIRLDGLFTHFASSDGKDLTKARKQLATFASTLRELQDAGFSFSHVHAANSAAIMSMPEAHFDMVRQGISLYGLYPSDEMDKSLMDLWPAMSIKATLAEVKRVPAGFSVSYGHTYVTERETLIGTVPVGYADGYDRHLSSAGTMLVRGRRVPVVGRVCMDQTMIDLGNVPDAEPGDEVVILGRQGQEEVSADEIARQIGTINYEVVSRIMPRVKRIYAG